jgi:diguanylate cyclase (GGDEF)-like protein
MDSSTSHVTLLEAARTVARGGELDAKLDALAEHVRDATDASAVLILLLDPVGNVLLPAAQAGLDPDALDQSRAVTIDDAADVAARAVRDRRSTGGGGGGGGAESTSLAHYGHAAESVLALPLVISDDMGDETAEGVLLTAYDGTAPDPADADDTLLALADLCAVAIRNARLQSALHERAEWLDRLANTDSLTGLANRTTLLSMLELEIARARRQATELSLVIFAIDDYDGIVERAGASAADDVLRLVASTLADHVRLVDTIGRLGAHEFGLVAPGGGGAVVARRVQEAAGRIEAGGQPVSVSAGTAVLGTTEGGGEELLAGASAALAEARRRGRGQLSGVGA